MAATNYECSGEIRLTRPEEELPKPEAGELEALEAAAKRLGYTLERDHKRSKLKYYINRLMAKTEYRELNLALEVDESGRSYYDFEVLGFTWPITESKIDTVCNLLPGFIRALESEEGIATAFDIELADPRREANTILLSWVEGELLRAEVAPEKIERITQAELNEREARWAREHPEG